MSKLTCALHHDGTHGPRFVVTTVGEQSLHHGLVWVSPVTPSQADATRWQVRIAPGRVPSGMLFSMDTLRPYGPRLGGRSTEVGSCKSRQGRHE